MSSRIEIIGKIAEQFHSLKHKMMGVNCFDNEKFHVTPAQLHVLFIVREHDGISSKEIAKSLNISSSAATQLIDGLVSNNFLVRESDQVDRRVIKIHLSVNSEKFVMNMRSKRLERLNSIFSCLDDTELQTYYELTEKMTKNIVHNSDIQK